MLLIVPVTTVLMILLAEAGGASRGALASVISCSNWGGTAAGAATGGVLVAQFSYDTLSWLLAGTVLMSGLLMTSTINNAAVERIRVHFPIIRIATGP